MLSGQAIESWFERLNIGTPNIIRYPEIKETTDIDDLELSPCNFILYEIEPRVGHWTILFYNDIDNIVEFFDSYSMMVDDQLEYTYHKHPLLTELMIDSAEQMFEINEFPFQNKTSANCGKICCIRYLFNVLGYSKEQFNKFFYEDIEDIDARDELIAMLYDVMDEKFES